MTFEKEYSTELLSSIIEYNHNKYIAFRDFNLDNFVINEDYEKILNARYCKVARIKRRLVYLLTRCDYVWFITFTFSDKYINRSTRTKRDLIKSVLNTHDFIYILNVLFQ